MIKQGKKAKLFAKKLSSPDIMKADVKDVDPEQEAALPPDAILAKMREQAGRPFTYYKFFETDHIPERVYGFGKNVKEREQRL